MFYDAYVTALKKNEYFKLEGVKMIKHLEEKMWSGVARGMDDIDSVIEHGWELLDLKKWVT